MKKLTKTQEEADDLKRQWLKDPCWDIEGTEGFEDYKTELKYYREQIEVNEAREYLSKMSDESKKLGIEGNIKLTEYILRLEYRIQKLEQNER